jgi:hypothetical protein
MIDATIVYPHRRCSFTDFLTGNIDRIIVRIRIREIPAYILHGNYRDDPEYRKAFQDWVNHLWFEKDALMGEITAGDQGSL